MPNKGYNISLGCEPFAATEEEVFEGADSCGWIRDKTQALELF
jgi:hypothetical protein